MKKLLWSVLLVAAAFSMRGQSVDMKEILGANNAFNDPVCGISLTYPPGWEVLGGTRWGKNNRENTFGLRPLWPSEARPSLYYQPFSEDNPHPSDAEAYFRTTAQKKEQSRVPMAADYKNQQDTYKFGTIGGRPSFSYSATFTMAGRKMEEYFVRIIGEKMSLMFFTMGTPEEIDAIRAEIDRMASTVRLP